MRRRTRASSWRARLCALATLAAVLAAPQSAMAWNATGHVLIALLAYDALVPAQRAALTQLLEAHPRFGADLVPALPPSLPDGARDRWLFALAATWPDLARGQPLMDHGTWHYVNLPLTLRQGGLVSCQQARRELPDSMRRSAELDAARRAQGLPGIPSGDSIREALPKNLRTLSDVSASREERALALSWVLHLVGDVHQPLHTVALFTAKRFVSGDRGGNDILVHEQGALHHVWDDLLGIDATPDAIESSLRKLMRPPAPAVRVPSDVGAWVDRWIDEGCEQARAGVYAPSVLRVVERFEAGPHAAPAPSAAAASAAAAAPAGAAALPKPELVASPDYLRQARQRASERARIAAARLAALLAVIRF